MISCRHTIWIPGRGNLSQVGKHFNESKKVATCPVFTEKHGNWGLCPLPVNTPSKFKKAAGASTFSKHLTFWAMNSSYHYWTSSFTKRDKLIYRFHRNISAQKRDNTTFIGQLHIQGTWLRKLHLLLITLWARNHP